MDFRSRLLWRSLWYWGSRHGSRTEGCPKLPAENSCWRRRIQNHEDSGKTRVCRTVWRHVVLSHNIRCEYGPTRSHRQTSQHSGVGTPWRKSGENPSLRRCPCGDWPWRNGFSPAPAGGGILRRVRSEGQTEEGRFESHDGTTDRGKME